MTEIMVLDRVGIAPAVLVARAGQAANQAAAAGVFEDYTSRKATNTLRRQVIDLAAFEGFLQSVGVPVGNLRQDPEAWTGISWGLVEAYKRWLLSQGYAVGTINFRISTVKVYARLAMKAGAIEPQEYAMIHAVEGYAHKEIARINEHREEIGIATRKGAKKAESVSITPDQARQLKAQPDTPQGRRDAVLMTILLDHGLRCGEVAKLQVDNFDFKSGLMLFERPKVQKIQTHRLSKVALRAVRAYLEKDHPLLTGPLLIASRKGGKKGTGGGQLSTNQKLGMSERAITERVRYLGELIGIQCLSAHDCRHYWATQAARNGTHMERLKDAGGWNSLAMPSRYIEAAAIANEGVNLGAD